MKTTIRSSTFETNSSSVHAFVFIPDDFLATWNTPEHESDWLYFEKLLHDADAWGKGDIILDEPLTAHDGCLISAASANRLRCQPMCGYIEDDEVVNLIGMFPLELLSNPEPYREWGDEYPQVQAVENGIIVELDYEGWR